jgi:hypothetical protein
LFPLSESQAAVTLTATTAEVCRIANSSIFLRSCPHKSRFALRRKRSCLRRQPQDDISIALARPAHRPEPVDELALDRELDAATSVRFCGPNVGSGPQVGRMT